jgi:hypothetical protein
MLSRVAFVIAASAALAAAQPPTASSQSPAPVASRSTVHHALTLALDPKAKTIAVTAAVTPAGSATEIEFLLNSRLTLTRSTPAALEIPAGDVAWLGEIEGGEPGAGPMVKRYRVSLPEPGASIRLEYFGPFDFGLSDQREEYTRGFRSTTGVIAPEGVYLSGASAWYPLVGRELVTFDLTVTQPGTWRVVSEGSGTSRGDDGRARWTSSDPVDQIHVVGGPLHLTTEAAGAVEAQIYLHEPDAALAAKYLTATAQYLEMYRDLIGPYPYRKFALVENFWETGYGMPSFTLLGPQIIRFPFILTSSYPHEILHNWWGNSVFVDETLGNWSEGLTAYLADHLLQEQRGEDATYRRSTLQKYRDYVSTAQDFPLTRFRGRHSAATEAVGYGRTLMGFHALRRTLGDDAFRQFLARFYRDFRGRRASFDDIRTTAEAVAGRGLQRFFDDWITRTGAPVLELAIERIAKSADGHVVHGVVRQTQPGAPFALDVPVFVQTTGAPASAMVPLAGAEARFEVVTKDPPLAVHVDPAFDLFRRLDARETPPSLGQLFGDPKPLVVIAADEPAPRAAAYRAMAESWRAPSHAPEIVSDADLTALPADRSVWLFGRGNRFAAALAAGTSVAASGDAMRIDGQRLALSGHAAVIVRRHPQNADKAVGWIVADGVDSLPGLGRKLPHYGKYSYLGFEGAEPTNMLKGQWATSDSSLTADARAEADRKAPLPAFAVPAGPPLATLPPVFSEQTLREHIDRLTSSQFEGRGIGTRGLGRAAEYLAAQFERIGLAPGAGGGSYLQTFETTRTPDGLPATLANVVGIIPGSEPSWRGQSVLLTAHYDHLGMGWPDPRRGDEGKLHPGADDNASGVAAMLEVARALAASGAARRTVVVIAFTGEDAGLIGSRHYVEHPVLPRDGIRAIVNLDSVGRLGGGQIGVLGAGTAAEWPHVFRGIGFVTGIQTQLAQEALPASDQASFAAAGIPGVQLFTPPHADYHRPTDTADKIDVAGLVKIATVAREAIAYLADRPEPLTATIGGPATANTPAPPSGDRPARRAGLGLIPEFAFSGPGVKASGLIPGSPAEKAGMRAGDVLLEVAGTTLASLRAYSDLLKTLAPGQSVPVVFERDGQRHQARVVLADR